MITIQNATIWTPFDSIDQGQVIIEQERIVEVSPARARPLIGTVIDATGLQLAPGFFDLQINGAFGHDFTAVPGAIWTVGSRLPQYGVTSFLPTIITAPMTKIEAAQAALRHERPDDYQGATPLGLHLEGPFLNPQKKGAHNSAYLQQPDLPLVSNWHPDQGVKLVTLAPELSQARQLITALNSRGIVVSAGHSMATLAQAQQGFEAGIRYGTHLFNAMPAIHHREPGLIGALLDRDDIIVGLIADGIHVHPALIKMVFRALGPQRLNLVTDAMAALGMPPGNYVLADQTVAVDDQTVHLADGTLAGSVLSCDAALRNLIKFSGCSLAEALPTLTSTPAKLLGLNDNLGHIKPGYQADLILLTPELKVALTMVAGEVVYQNIELKAKTTYEPT